MLQPGNYSLVLTLQFLLLIYDLFVNSFSELLRSAPVIQLVLFIRASELTMPAFPGHGSALCFAFNPECVITRMADESTVENGEYLCVVGWIAGVVRSAESRGRAVFLLLQEDCANPGRFSLLPRLAVATQ
ncbi:transmembrane protein 138 isoform 2-T2 [Leptodactylus fuscus]